MSVSNEGKAVFTGIVSDLGEVLEVREQADGLRRLTVACGYDPDTIEIGASIACSGPCLTVVERGHKGNRAFFAVDVAAETLRVTTAGSWQRGTKINLERSLRLGDELGGHLVSGHVDGIAELVVREDLPEMARLSLRAPRRADAVSLRKKARSLSTASRSRSTRSKAIRFRCSSFRTR